jgi:signal transduction histidine kinase/CheY-like chemotaxis protein/sensor domain CHASE-containing protein
MSARSRLLLVVGGVGLAASIGFALVLDGMPRRGQGAELAGYGIAGTTRIAEDVAYRVGQVEAVGALLAGVERLTRDQFDSLAGALVRHHGGLRAIAWAAPDPAGPASGYKPAPLRIIHATPGAPARLALNRLAAGDPVIDDLTRRAVAYGSFAFSARFRLASGGWAVIVARPVYDGMDVRPPGVLADRLLRGVIYGVYPLAQLFAPTARTLSAAGVILTISDLSASGADQFLFSNVDAARVSTPDTSMGDAWSDRLAMGDRVWGVVLQSNGASAKSTWSAAALPALAVGLILTALVIAAMAAILQRFEASAPAPRGRDDGADRPDGTVPDTIESLPVAIMLFDRDDGLAMWNKHATTVLTEFADLFVAGTPRDAFVSRTEERGAVERRRRKYEVPERVRADRSAMGDGGEEIGFPGDRWFRVNQVRSADGGRLFVLSDISELKAVEGHLRDQIWELAAIKARTEAQSRELTALNKTLSGSRDTAQAANQAKSDFLAMVSHEIRTPMNGVLGLVDLILESDLSEEQRECAEMAHGCGETVLTIINDVLDLSRIEAGKLDLEDRDFDLHDAATGVVDLLAPSAHEKRIGVAIYVDPRVPRQVRGDAGRLRQVLINLVGNAIKFTDRGGVVLEIGLADTGDATESPMVEIKVVDTGVGIEANFLDKVFATFSQGASKIAGGHGGSGLGLAISHRLVGLMGGKIGVVSTLGKGSTFWFHVPLLDTLAEDGGLDLPAGFADLRALVVDDDPLHRGVLVRQMAAWGIAVDGVGSADAAMESLRGAHGEGNPFGAVVIDRNLPEGSGRRFVQAVRDDPVLSGTPVVTMRTVHGSSAGDGQPGASRGASLIKPVHPVELFARLATAVANCAPCPPGAEAERPADPASRAATQRWHILLAEDNKVNQMVAVRMLTLSGHEVEVVDNGADAVSAVRAGNFDLVLMDVQMPELNGLDATRAIRGLDGDKATVPIVAMTADAMLGDRDKCLAAGMDDYLPKPVDKIELDAAVGRWGGRTSVSAGKAPTIH